MPKEGKEDPLMLNLKLALFTVSLRGGQEDLLRIFKRYAEKTQKNTEKKLKKTLRKIKITQIKQQKTSSFL